MPASIIGLSGPSSSGKTTLARLLQSIFSNIDESLQTFIIHEDDFYHPDDKIPYTTTPSGTIIQDWDCVEAIDIPFLASALSYARTHGSLPPRLKSKEDQNEASDSGVDPHVLDFLRQKVRRRLSSSSGKETDREIHTLAFLEGFLLYSPPPGETPSHPHALHPVHTLIDVHLFLPAPYDLVKERREKRSGYVTIGPAPVPTALPRQSGGTQGEDEDAKEGEGEGEGEVDLNAEDDRPPQNFWTDPPGYVDDIVWPRYVQDHAWLLLPEEAGSVPLSSITDTKELIECVGRGVNVRTDAGVIVAPGQGGVPMTDLLYWAVDEVLEHLEAINASEI